MTILQQASDAFSKATKPIEDAGKNIPGLSETANEVSQALIDGKHWREGGANVLRTSALSTVGSLIGGPEGAAMGAKMGEDLKNE